MTRGLVIMLGIAVAAEAGGLTLLFRPSAGRRLLGVAESEQATYGLRIAGMMLAALGLFLGGFATIFHFASAA